MDGKLIVCSLVAQIFGQGAGSGVLLPKLLEEACRLGKNPDFCFVNATSQTRPLTRKQCKTNNLSTV
jgi:hypothetical protein